MFASVSPRHRYLGVLSLGVGLDEGDVEGEGRIEDAGSGKCFHLAF